MRSYNQGVAVTEVDLGGIVGAIAARARALSRKSDPGGLLEGLSGQLQELIPHDRVMVLCLDDGGRTVSVFAEHASAMRRATTAAPPSLWLVPIGIPVPKPSRPVSLRGRPSSSGTH